MRTLDQWLDEYAVAHRNPVNKALHWICVPAIAFSLLALVAQIPFPNLFPSLFPESVYINWATVLVALALIFYARLSVLMFLGMAAFSAFILIAVATLDKRGAETGMIALAVFTIAWVGQFIGHAVEGRRPSFLQDMQFLLIGPAWLLSFIYSGLGLRYRRRRPDPERERGQNSSLLRR